MLHDSGYPVEIFLIKFSDKLSKDCKLNLDRLKRKVAVQEICAEDEMPLINNQSVIIDALLGTGTARAPEGLVLKVIEQINGSENQIIAIDLPSGLFADSSSQSHAGKIVQANITLTIGMPKLALFMPENGSCGGEWHLIPIGLSEEFISSAETNLFFSTFSALQGIVKPRSVFSHKGSFGHSLIIAGSKGKTGAAVLATRANLRSGCGLTTIHCPADSLNIIQTSAPEAMASVDSEKDFVSTVPDLSPFSAVAFGPGCGQNKATASALKLLIQNSKIPLVIDADGLNIIAENKTWLAFLPQNSILTPHPGEFKRLFGDYSDDFARLQGAMKAAVKFRCIIVLKGAYTAIASPTGQAIFNPTGNPGMAKGGSGDVLTGLLTGLLARGIPALQAAILGVFLHGLAGDYAARSLTQESMTSADLIDFLPKAWATVVQ